jgi:hypothetical protein
MELDNVIIKLKHMKLVVLVHTCSQSLSRLIQEDGELSDSQVSFGLQIRTCLKKIKHMKRLQLYMQKKNRN